MYLIICVGGWVGIHIYICPLGEFLFVVDAHCSY